MNYDKLLKIAQDFEKATENTEPSETRPRKTRREEKRLWRMNLNDFTPEFFDSLHPDDVAMAKYIEEELSHNIPRWEENKAELTALETTLPAKAIWEYLHKACNYIKSYADEDNNDEDKLWNKNHLLENINKAMQVANKL
jgi:hypothetical protein